jgi:hypothetical protein
MYPFNPMLNKRFMFPVADFLMGYGLRETDRQSQLSFLVGNQRQNVYLPL